MKKYCLVAWAAVFVSLLAPPLHADYIVGLSHGMEKLRAQDAIPDDAQFHLFAAKNEWEMFQVYVMDDTGLSGVDVNVTAFTGPGSDIETVELYRVAYVPVTAETISQKPPDMTKIGDWPDGLIPFVDHFLGEVRDGAPFDVEPGRNQAVLADLYVPADQTPGEYTATVTVTATGRTPWTGTVTLTVWDFVLPNSISIESAYNYNQGLSCSYHAAHGGVTSCDNLYWMYMREFARHRMGIYQAINSYPGYSWNYDTATFDWDWSAFDAFHGPLWDGTFYVPGYKFTSISLPYAPGGCPGDVSGTDWEREWWRGWADHFRGKGWLDKLFLYLPDEPDPSEYAWVAGIADRLHNADPDLRAMVTEQVEDALAGHIDIWDPDEPMFSDALPWPPYPEVYAERRAMGETTWWYNCVSAASAFVDFANHFVDYPGMQMRIWTWLTRHYGFTGILFWQTNFQYAYTDPWETQYIDMWLVQGDGTLVYPGTVDRIGGTSDVPVAGLRMKYLREAMEDYEYFHILDERGDSDWVDDLTRSVAPKSFQWEHDWRKVLDFRRKVAEKILGTLDEAPPAPPTNLSAGGVTQGAVLSWTAPEDGDLAGFELWYALYEGDAFFGGFLGAGETHARVTGLRSGRDYSFWMKSFDTNGNRSAASDVVVALAGYPDDDADEADSLKEFAGSPNMVRVRGAEGDDDDNGSRDGKDNLDGGSGKELEDGHSCASGCGM